jgi:hypothetical protein
MPKAAKSQLLLRVILLDPPAGVKFRAQRGRDALAEPVAKAADRIVFEMPIDVADASASPPRLTGEYAQGPAGGRFLYINSGTSAGDPGSPWTRRVKVHLSTIDPDLIQRHLDAPGSVIECAIAGKAKDGGPCCATVPLIRGWALAEGSG